MNENLIGFKSFKIINLTNVSSIHIDTYGKKVIFNMNYSVKIFNNKFTADYVYWQYDSDEELNKITNLIENNTSGWIYPIEEGQRYVNKDTISSITFESRKRRVIFNLNFNKTHPKDDRKMTSDFIFYDFIDNNNFTEFVELISKNIKY